MKQFFAVCIAVIFSGMLTAFDLPHTPTTNTPAASVGNVRWYTWDEATQLMKKKKKKIFVDVYTDWCGWCKRMDANTFEQPIIAAYLNENFYPVKLNAEQRGDITFNNHTFKFVDNGARGYHELAAALLEGRLSYPTTVYLNEDFQIIQRVPGYLDVETFGTIIHYFAENRYSSTPWADYQKEYKARTTAPATPTPSVPVRAVGNH